MMMSSVQNQRLVMPRQQQQQQQQHQQQKLEQQQQQIRPLQQASVNRIVAGQAVTDLSSAVKELVDNALDAGSKSINIRLFDRGLEIVEVSDDGCGVPVGDSRLYMATPHATSKIQAFEDIYNGKCLHSMGFRGEALACLANLSAGLIVATRTAAESTAQKLSFGRDGRLDVLSIASMPRKVGTTVAVVRLLEAVPVRRADMIRRIQSQRTKLIKMMEGYAIFSKGVRINLMDMVRQGQEERSVLSTATNNASIRQNVSSVLGSKFLTTVTSINIDLTAVVATNDRIEEAASTTKIKENQEKNDSKNDKDSSNDNDDTAKEEKSEAISQWKVEGFISKMVSSASLSQQRGGATRGVRDGVQYYSINGRPVDLPKVSRILNEVWKGFGGKKKRPACVLAFTLPAPAYDINLSPDKRMVMLMREDDVLQCIRDGITRLWASQTEGRFSTAAPIPIPANLGNNNNNGYISSTMDSDEDDDRGDTGTNDIDDENHKFRRRNAFVHDFSKAKLQHEYEDQRQTKRSKTPDAVQRQHLERLNEFRNGYSSSRVEASSQQQEEQCPESKAVAISQEKEIDCAATQDDKEDGSSCSGNADENNNIGLETSHCKLDHSTTGMPKSVTPSPEQVPVPILREGINESTTLHMDRSHVNDSNNGTWQQQAESLDKEGKMNQNTSIYTPICPSQRRSTTTVSEHSRWTATKASFGNPGGSSGMKEEILSLQNNNSNRNSLSADNSEGDDEKHTKQAPPRNDKGSRKGPSFDLERFGFRAITKNRASLSKQQQPHRKLSDQQCNRNDDVDEKMRCSVGGKRRRENENSSRRGATIDSCESEPDTIEQPRSKLKTNESNIEEEMQNKEVVEEGHDEQAEVVWDSFEGGSEQVMLSFRRERLAAKSKKRCGHLSKQRISDISEEETTLSSTNSDSATNCDDVNSKRKSKDDDIVIDSSEGPSNILLSKADLADMVTIGQFNLGFIVARSKDNHLWILDQHACDEKYNFEKLLKDTVIHEQKLLKPMPLELSPAEETCVLDNMSIFEKNGFRFQYSADEPPRHRLALTGVPHSGARDGRKAVQFGKEDVSALCAILLGSANDDDYDDDDNPSGGTGVDGTGTYGNNAVRLRSSTGYLAKGDTAEKMIARLPKTIAMFASRACRDSIMIGKPLSHVEMERLIQQTAKLEHPWTCAHGRPTIQHIANLTPWQQQDQKNAAAHISGPTVTVASQEEETQDETTSSSRR